MSSIAPLLIWSCLWPTFGKTDLPRIPGVELGVVQLIGESLSPLQLSEDCVPAACWVRPAERFDRHCVCDLGDQAIEFESDSDDDWFTLAPGFPEGRGAEPVNSSVHINDLPTNFASARGHSVLRC